MKIKTITCHDVYNVGASLQAYALVTYLRKLGCRSVAGHPRRRRLFPGQRARRPGLRAGEHR